MTKDFTICIGTVGAGVWHSPNSGEKWRRSKMNLPFHAEPGEIQIRALAVYPQDPNRILAGSEVGLYRSEDKGATWDLVESPIPDGAQIWSVAVHPTNPDVIFAGTKPPALYRSTDGGKHWEKLPIPIVERCFAGAPKVTNIVFDPRDHRSVWVGVEIDGVYCSRDGGDSWTHLPPLGDNFLNQDVHGLTIGLGKPTKLHVTTPDGIWTSTTEGESWTLHGFPRFFERDKISYCRGVALKPDNPDVIFVGNGDFIPGKTGAIQRSTDGGKTWEAAKLSMEPNSTIYWFGTHPADPDIIIANSLHGYVYTSTDGGESWNKIKQEFGEIRAVAWTPN
jgi:photosystem II stability/assembly factor-like uncharacterized protein